ncbi:MAG: hypothetical protein SPLUMA1_SPLUMAMAG1_00600 [uncultured Sulfurimonas sp.]|nr:MAG: hypothetical protein SPLUMA1_SPLUMAMAG1_00600 [uncultured Sulfurimonas sp.]
MAVLHPDDSNLDYETMAKEMELAAGDRNDYFEYTQYLEAIRTAVSTIKI